MLIVWMATAFSGWRLEFCDAVTPSTTAVPVLLAFTVRANVDEAPLATDVRVQLYTLPRRAQPAVHDTSDSAAGSRTAARYPPGDQQDSFPRSAAGRHTD